MGNLVHYLKWGGSKYLGDLKSLGGPWDPLANHVLMTHYDNIAVYQWIVCCLNLVCQFSLKNGWILSILVSFLWILSFWLNLAESGWVWLSLVESGWVQAESGLSLAESGWVWVNLGEYWLSPLYITNAQICIATLHHFLRKN